ncbi:AAA domain-containing protein [Fusarium sp. LHS14.1]|nr:AAA domain-containing protein [Fusarium sp. LHS14.1]
MTMTGLHQLPEWFLSHNVILKESLVGIQPIVEVVDTVEEKTTKSLCKAGNDQGGKRGQDPTKCQISSDVFSMARNMTASAFVRNPEGQLDEWGAFFVLQGGTMAAPIDFLDELVKAVAKDIGASLITFDLEDLEDLGLEFSIQTPTDSLGDKTDKSKDRKKEKGWNPSLAKHWFAASSQTDTDAKREAKERAQRSFSTILDAIPSNQPDAAPEDGDATETIRHEQPDSTRPVLVHVSEIPRMLAMGKGHRFLARLCDCIDKRRENGQAIAVVLTVPEPNVTGCSCLQCSDGRRMDWRMIDNDTCATRFADYAINPININPKDFDHTDYVASANLRRLKRVLRQRLRHIFDPEILHPHADWKQLVCKEPGQCFGRKAWDMDNLYPVFLQINGLSFGKEKLEADDILLILSKAGFHKHELPAEKNDQESTKVVVEEVEKNEPAKKMSWMDKMKALRQKCNSAEQNLVDCVINPDEIQSSYSQVIIEKELKETVLHLVSSAYLTPLTPPTSLLSQARIKGILLYGPPGTAKTHLTRSIAKESGASMLCVDGASLLSKYVGEIEKNIKAAFTLAAKLHPCILFIDEVDSLFYDRGMARRTWERSAVTQFLMQMDGLAQNDKAPCVIVATNRPNALDNAFLRRLPQKIPIGLPDMKSRSDILRVFLEGEDLEPLVNMDSLARETEGYSGSDLRSLCAEAALIWAIENSKKGRENGSSDGSDKMRLGLTHFAKGLQRIRPSVLKKDLLELESFRKRFNPHSIG